MKKFIILLTFDIGDSYSDFYSVLWEEDQNEEGYWHPLHTETTWKIEGEFLNRASAVVYIEKVLKKAKKKAKIDKVKYALQISTYDLKEGTI